MFFEAMEACAQGDIARLSALLPRIDLSKQYNSRKTLLIVACEHGHLEIVQILCARGIKVNTKDENGRSPLMIACALGHLRIVKYLISRTETVIGLVDHEGMSAFMIACEKRHHRIVKALLPAMKHRGINAKNRKGETALMMACRANDEQMVCLLLENGASLGPKNAQGARGMDLASSIRVKLILSGAHSFFLFFFSFEIMALTFHYRVQDKVLFVLFVRIERALLFVSHSRESPFSSWSTASFFSNTTRSQSTFRLFSESLIKLSFCTFRFDLLFFSLIVRSVVGFSRVLLLDHLVFSS